MTAISNGSGFDPSVFAQRSTERFKAADLDGNEQVSKDEFLKVASANGIDASRMETVFSKIDRNGDGSISKQEHQQMTQKVQERMSSMLEKAQNGQGGFDALLALMETLKGTLIAEPSEKDQLNDGVIKLKSGDKSDTTVNKGVSLINNPCQQLTLVSSQ